METGSPFTSLTTTTFPNQRHTYLNGLSTFLHVWIVVMATHEQQSHTIHSLKQNKIGETLMRIMQRQSGKYVSVFWALWQVYFWESMDWRRTFCHIYAGACQGRGMMTDSVVGFEHHRRVREVPLTVGLSYNVCDIHKELQVIYYGHCHYIALVFIVHPLLREKVSYLILLPKDSYSYTIVSPYC